MKSTKISENNVKDDVKFEGKSTKELKEICTTLQSQLIKYQTMTIKAQGALEVILQMLPEGETLES